MASSTSWVIAPPKKVLVVGVADMMASNDPGVELVTYSLGSCLGIAVYDAQRRVGGLLHVMLPSGSIDPAKAARSPCMFVDTGIPLLFRAVSGLGADPRRCMIRVAGGARMLDAGDVFCIGQRNDARVTEVLREGGYTVHARDVGGLSYRTIRMCIGTGQITVQTPGRAQYTL